jgi:diphosphomevalonate decarboxylase
LAEAFAGLLKGDVDKKKISIMARRGSGSAARSVFGGFVRLQTGRDDESYAVQVFDEKHWDIRDVIAVVDPGQKKVKSRDGMRLSTKTCPPEIYDNFVAVAESHVMEAEAALGAKDLPGLGQTYEFDNAFFREVCLNTEPALDYWTKATADVFNLVSELRSDGLEIFAGTDAGPNVHIFCEPDDASKLTVSLHKLAGVKEIIHARPGGPSVRLEDHLI